MAIRLTQVYVSVVRPRSGTVPQNVSDVLGLTAGEDAFLVSTFRTCTNTLAINNSGHNQVTHQYVYGSCVNTFALLSACGINPTEDIVQYLGLTRRTVLPVSNSFFNVISNHGSLLYYVQYADPITQSFSWEQGLLRAHKADNVFTFTEFAASVFPQDVVQILGISQDANYSETEFDRDDGAQHCIQQHLSYTLNNGPCVEKNYRPFVSEAADDEYEAISETPPTLVKQTLTLYYPMPLLLGPGNTVFEFKNPAFGNTDSLQFTVIDRTTRGGDRIIYGDPKWAKAQLFEFTIENVKKDVMEQFVEFVNLSLGKDIGIADWFGQQFKGVIIAPQSPITETRSGYTITLRFQGEKYSF